MGELLHNPEEQERGRLTGAVGVGDEEWGDGEVQLIHVTGYTARQQGHPPASQTSALTLVLGSQSKHLPPINAGLNEKQNSSEEVTEAGYLCSVAWWTLESRFKVWKQRDNGPSA